MAAPHATLEAKRERYYNEFNLLRAFAILGVISVHVCAYFYKMSQINAWTYFYMIIDAYSHVGVPLFIFISGFILYNKYPNVSDISYFYSRRVRRIIPAYLFFSTLYLFASYIGAPIIGKDLDLSVSQIIVRYLTGTCFYHLWFFVLIIQLYLLYPTFVIIYNRIRLNSSPLFLIIVLLFVQSSYIASKPETQLVKTVFIFIGYIFYFAFGMFIKENYTLYFSNIKHIRTLYLLPILILGMCFVVSKYTEKYL